MASTLQKKSWADDVEDLIPNSEIPEQPKIEDFVDEDGVRTTIEYTMNEDGKKVKITRRTRRVLQKSVVEHKVAERQKWGKFGKEMGNKPGPDRATTTIGETVTLKLSAGNKEAEQVSESTPKPDIVRKGGGQVVCRMCKGAHFTAKCPYKDSLAGLEQGGDLAALDDDIAPATTNVGNAASSGVAPSTGGKYVPPSMRGGTGRSEMGRTGSSRDELPTLRVTNISEDTQENDLRELFGVFGRVARVYVGRDRETGAGKGFAFVSFEERAIAQRAMEKVNGKGYDNLILSVQWSQPRPEQR